MASRMNWLWVTLADPDPATNGQLIYSEGLIRAARGCRRVAVRGRPQPPREAGPATRCQGPGVAARRGKVVAALAAHHPLAARGGAARCLGVDEPGAVAGARGAAVGGDRVRQHLRRLGVARRAAAPDPRRAAGADGLHRPQSRDHRGTPDRRRRARRAPAAQGLGCAQDGALRAQADRRERSGDVQHAGRLPHLQRGGRAHAGDPAAAGLWRPARARSARSTPRCRGARW